jgi:exonuclease SbcC
VQSHAKVGYRQTIHSKEKPDLERGRAFLFENTDMAVDPKDTHIEAVCAASDAGQGLAMLQAIDDETALADVARNARLWEVRLAAVQRVTDSALLERIAEATKHRDDRVYRYCQELLRARRRDVARVTQAAQLAAGFRGLIETTPEARSQAAGTLRELERALAELRTEGEVPQEVIDLAATAREGVDAAVHALRELGAAAALAEALRAEIEDAAPQADVAALRERLAALAGAFPEWLAGNPTAAALASSLERARERLDEIAPPPVPAPQKEKKKRKAASPRSDDILGLVGKLEGHLEAGQLAQALEIEKRIAAGATPAPLPVSLERRLKRNLAQLAQMRDWAKWGDDQGREHLIQDAEALLAEQADMEALAASVRTLRERWKKRDAERPASKAQWERFDAILTRAFRPVLDFRARRAAEEKAASEARAALCDELEAWLAGPEGAAAPIREADAKRSEFVRRLRALPAAKPDAERKSRKRLDRIFKALDARRDAVRGAETARREELIARAEALKDAPAGDSIKAAIALQKAWKETGGVHLGRKEEQALWARFHAATNAVFARRDEQRSKQDEERAKQDAARRQRDEQRQAERRALEQKNDAHRGRFERLAARSSLIEKLEAAAAGGGVPEQLATEVAEAWKALPPLGMDGEKALQARLAAAPKAGTAQLEKGHAEREHMLLDLEVALGIPSPESFATQRRERQLKALQERFKSRRDAPEEAPEATIARWYSIAARADATQAGRMTAIVRALTMSALQESAPRERRHRRRNLP